ncbi:TPA: flagellar basal body-associated protein FliL [Escherichia coli]|nr:flagellar basal body-associated protein FliL [Escherichia coli]HAJ4046874.1 flagellar basal body-associated protein FliL [Escherichia coli]HAJ4131689.1 flagellar basal body-associated protein FliL [Escherichia coli]HAJ4151802.1 flagellar basal body-associated protein FliL [Escherichia coli]HAJ4269537.1 flagellar basal body-associated protein FliL [Escherichia coli]
MTDYAISKKSKRSLWIPILVFITLAACASAGYSYWHSHQVAADDKAQQRVVPSPVFYALDTFTVNLGDADRVLYIGITLRLKDEATRSRLSEYLPEVRSRLLLLFSRQDAAVLATEEGKKSLIAEIKATLSTPLVAGQTREADLGLFARLANTGPLQGPEAVPMRILLPAYVTSELKTAFQIGFTIFIPFLIIDLVIASVLMALGMMMVPPATIALPFKLMLFVLVDGWQLLVGSLAQSFYS